MTYLWVYDGHWWLIGPAYVGTVLVAMLIAWLLGVVGVVEDLVTSLRDRNERIAAEREARQ